MSNEQAKDFKDRLKANRDNLDLTLIPRDSLEYVTFESIGPDAVEHLQFLLAEWHLMTGIPVSIFHPDIEQSSGESLERQLSGFRWRIQRLHRELELIVPEIAGIAGLPNPPVSFNDIISVGVSMGTPAGE